MSLTRQERKSCEACRTRKLKCTGEKSGCSRCRGLSLTCRFKDKGAPGRPRKRPREEYNDGNSPNKDERTGSSSASPHPLSVIPQAALVPQEAVNMLMGPGEFDSLPYELSANCGFDSSQWEMLENGDISSFPIELLQTSRQNELPDPGLQPNGLDAYGSPMSFSRSCKCDEEVSDLVRTLSRANMSHEVISMLRRGISLAEKLLICSLCYDVTKPPRVTVQNVLLIGQLMLEVTSGYQKYLHWLDEHCSETDLRNESNTVYLGSGLGVPLELDLQISGRKLRELVTHGLQADAERLLGLGKQFAQRQRNRHMVGHESCPDPEGRCRKKEDGIDHDPLDLCPQNPVARKLVPCFRIVDEVHGMIEQVANAVA
ncbi:transcriptional regulator family: Fungal Specific TF [Penicillium sp. DV-2018c]|nr:transcriptional regulator family: Fungal Specific TF [Penicillium sp. DV-2018c]